MTDLWHYSELYFRVLCNPLWTFLVLFQRPFGRRSHTKRLIIVEHLHGFSTGGRDCSSSVSVMLYLAPSLFSSPLCLFSLSLSLLIYFKLRWIQVTNPTCAPSLCLSVSLALVFERRPAKTHGSGQCGQCVCSKWNLIWWWNLSATSAGELKLQLCLLMSG